MENAAESAETSGAASRAGLFILLGAAILAIGAVAYRAMDDSDAEPAVTPSDPAMPLSIAELEERAQADPKDANAWEELGFAYYADGRYADAARAYRQAVEGAPNSASLWAALGEARVLSSEDDPMPPLAVQAFQKALELEPSQHRARYYMAARTDLAGDHEAAIAEWIAILEEAPAGAIYVDNLVRTIEQVGRINGIEVANRIAAAQGKRPQGPELTAGEAIPGPSQQQIDAARAIAPGEQRNMAEGMVERLETRLKGDPSNVDGWVMLMRSRMTLGQPDRASKALADAVAANPQAEGRLRQEAELLGVR